MGGQIGDQGSLISKDLEIHIFDTIKVNDTVIHRGKLTKGTLSENAMNGVFTAKVNDELRIHLRRNHSATHLLQASLRQVLGDHIVQQGSRVAPDSLRFDFSHFSALTPEQIIQVENIVNEKIMECLPVSTHVMKLEDAQASGATALFGEKYEEDVRVVSVAHFSKELCGGLHVSNSGQIGSFKILSESSVSAGVRRIEAVTGMKALELTREDSSILTSLRDKLRCKNEMILDRVEAVFENAKELERDLHAVKLELSMAAAQEVLKNPEMIEGVSLYIQELLLTEDKFKNLLDGVQAWADLDSVAVLFNKAGESGSIAVIVGKNAQKKGLKAGDIVKSLADLAGGKGGGRPDRAQAGTRELQKMSAAVVAVKDLVKGSS